jgi:hypothetical protein
MKVKTALMMIIEKGTLKQPYDKKDIMYLRRLKIYFDALLKTGRANEGAQDKNGETALIYAIKKQSHLLIPFWEPVKLMKKPKIIWVIQLSWRLLLLMSQMLQQSI